MVRKSTKPTLGDSLGLARKLEAAAIPAPQPVIETPPPVPPPPSDAKASSRDGRVNLSGWVTREMRDQVKIEAIRRGLTVQQAIEQAMGDWIAKSG